MAYYLHNQRQFLFVGLLDWQNDSESVRDDLVFLAWDEESQVVLVTCELFHHIVKSFHCTLGPGNCVVQAHCYSRLLFLSSLA